MRPGQRQSNVYKLVIKVNRPL